MAKGCIYEAKKTVGGKNELFVLCEQWMSAVKYWRHSIVVYLEGCTVEEEIGGFTVNFEPARIEAEIERLEKENAVDFDKVPSILRGKMALGNLKKYKELEVLLDFLKCRFTYKEGMTIESLTFKIRKLDGKERHYLRVEC